MQRTCRDNQRQRRVYVERIHCLMRCAGLVLTLLCQSSVSDPPVCLGAGASICLNCTVGTYSNTSGHFFLEVWCGFRKEIATVPGGLTAHALLLVGATLCTMCPPWTTSDGGATNCSASSIHPKLNIFQRKGKFICRLWGVVRGGGGGGVHVFSVPYSQRRSCPLSGWL